MKSFLHDNLNQALWFACAILMVAATMKLDHDEMLAVVTAEQQDIPQVPRPRAVGQFTVCPDSRSRTAIYSYEHLTWEVVNRGQAQRDPNTGFKGDDTIPHEWRASDGDYAGNGYDEGHLAPFGDFGHQSAADATFILTNAVPQSPQLNRNLWRMIEAYVRGLVDKNHEAYVVTLPLYLPDGKGVISISTIGKHRVWVPTDVAKAVLVVKDGDPQTMLAWSVPNVAPVDENADKFRVSVDQIEFDAGLDLYAWLDESVQRKLESAEP